MRPRAFLLTVLSLILLALLGRSGQAQQPQPTEYQLKAAFLFNFAKFIEWPTQAFTNKTSALVIGILGENPFHDDLARMVQNKLVDEHPLKVMEIKEFHLPADMTNCHILFVSNSEKERLPEILDALRGRPVLTVGESDNFIESGGMIRFFLEQTKIRFHINQDAATKSGLKISSKLMSLSSRPGS